jgi:multimeric flavodoxin WrbA
MYLLREDPLSILGFSSSPITGGNVDRMVQYILDHSAKQTEFINLTQLSYSPCRACAHLCADDNLCKLDDDLKSFFPKLMAADAIVLGTPSYFDNTNGFMTVFIERLWALRHQRFPLEGKPFVVVASGGLTSPQPAIEAVKRRMIAYRADFAGSVAFTSTILPCFKCGYGKVCGIGGSQTVYGEEGRKKLKITKALFKRWEDFPEIVRDLDNLCQILKEPAI